MKNDLVTVDVGKDFSRFPAGRTPDDSRYSGQAFRERYLKDNLAHKRKVLLILDNALSYGSSFLEEAFGGLVRSYGYDIKYLEDLIEIKSSDPLLIDEIWTYIRNVRL